MNIIMTGSTSFVGAATVRELLRRGHTVTAIVRPKSSKLDTILEMRRHFYPGVFS